ncbi:hypothetical protein [Nocardia bovistercoris]|uniref:Secreted protein n=1 Tax=Nocardia bovistercoris TaxID=2785916 RepID=A0A931IDI2_9NOCA|nr:hypothetical protein [Nocardia bovistercoris]MBH0778127.1 hypothetical protein [Nocardia bovistercoris]
MTALLALLILAASAYAIRRFAPRSETDFRLHRIHPRDHSDYDYQRRYSDLSAVHARYEPAESAGKPAARTLRNPLASLPESNIGAAKASFG